MQRHYTLLKQFEHDGFTVVVDKTWEDMHPSDCFDDSCYDIKDMCRKIDNGDLDWFMLRVRVLVEDIELTSEYLGACLYEDAEDVFNDGTAEDLIDAALDQARSKVYHLSRKFAALSEMVDRGEFSPYNTVNT